MQSLLNGKPSMSRRTLVKAAAASTAAGLVPGLQSAVYAQGSDKPEKEEVRIGFIPLTDCASVVMASVLGFDKKYGIKIVPTKEASWAGVRDKLVNGELDMAHWPRPWPTRATSSTSASWAVTRTAWARPGTTPTT